MTTQTDRDLQIAGDADNLAAALVNAPGGPPLTQGARLYAREAVLRFQAVTFGLIIAGATYRADMPEAELREWAASIASVIRG